ncbi:MAG: hypothetical protein ACFFDF_19555 [Candidatus Odinarchaeota archaeon]
MISISQIPSDFRCPNCGCVEFIDYGEFIECKNCRLEYFKEFIGSEIDEENLLSDQDLEGLSDSFSELKDEKTRRRFLKSLKEDLGDLNDLEE